jgi:hypothetical protein
MAMTNPPHPGDFIRTEIIEPAGLSVTAAAAALQISRPAYITLPIVIEADADEEIPQVSVSLSTVEIAV